MELLYTIYKQIQNRTSLIIGFAAKIHNGARKTIYSPIDNYTPVYKFMVTINVPVSQKSSNFISDHILLYYT